MGGGSGGGGNGGRTGGGGGAPDLLTWSNPEGMPKFDNYTGRPGNDLPEKMTISVSGNTYAVKDLMKRAGMSWSAGDYSASKTWRRPIQKSQLSEYLKNTQDAFRAAKSKSPDISINIT